MIWLIYNVLTIITKQHRCVSFDSAKMLGCNDSCFMKIIIIHFLTIKQIKDNKHNISSINKYQCTISYIKTMIHRIALVYLPFIQV
jgi:hypothetical protein